MRGTARAHAVSGAARRVEVVEIPGGRALVGTNEPVFPEDGESPLRVRTVAPFHMSRTAVSNRQFAAFVRETGYRTEAERFGWSFVFGGALAHARHVAGRVSALPWWCKVVGASWRHPRGPDSSVAGLHELPVVHVSCNDAAAFAMWAGGRLPTEVEWEHAARGGLPDVRYPWGDDAPDSAEPRCCVGKAGARDPAEIGPVPVDTFPANGFGLHNMVGNVWEWTSSSAHERDEPATSLVPRKVLKGGSYLCHPETCFRYRIAARITNTIDTSTGHTGFRIVFS